MRPSPALRKAGGAGETASAGRARQQERPPRRGAIVTQVGVFPLLTILAQACVKSWVSSMTFLAWLVISSICLVVHSWKAAVASGIDLAFVTTFVRSEVS